jgi:phosphatidylglycerophosphate synthase
MAGRAWDVVVANRISRSLRDTRVHPNHVTTLSLLVGLGAAALYASGSRAAAAWAAGLFVVSGILDHADGELARQTAKSSSFGRAYDRTADLLVRMTVFGGMGLGLRHGALGGAAPLLGLAAGLAFVVIFVLRSAMARQQGWDTIADVQVGGRDVEDVLYVIAPLTWLGWLTPFLVGAGVGAPLFALWVVRQYWRTSRKGEASRAASDAQSHRLSDAVQAAARR